MTDTRRIVYVDTYGMRVVLEVPWGNGSGLIPPPVITFHSDTSELRFVHQGNE